MTLEICPITTSTGVVKSSRHMNMDSIAFTKLEYGMCGILIEFGISAIVVYIIIYFRRSIDVDKNIAFGLTLYW